MRAAVILTLFLAYVPAAQAQREWRDTYPSRLEILALEETLNAELLASASATRTLEEWCSEHRMAAEPKIVAIRVANARKEPAKDVLQQLGVHDASDVKYRRVELRCGAHVLSEADNWYVPARLTPEMNTLLDTTDTPFGKAVQPLHPYRRTIAMTMLWTPLPRGWELHPPPASDPRRKLAVPTYLFEHRAILYTPDNRPFSEVVETYRADVLAFPR